MWSVGDTLPQPLMERFNGKDLASKMGRVLVAATLDDSGRPHLAMLSYGEVLALDEKTLRLGLWETSSTAKGVRQSGKLTLGVAEPGAVFYVKGEVRDLGRALDKPAPIGKFEMKVQDVLEDSDPSGEVSGGITFRLKIPEADLLRFWETQVKALAEG